MVLLLANQVLFILKPHSLTVLYLVQSLFTLICVMICYIVATYSEKNKNPLFITFKSDGNLFFEMRVTQRKTETVECSDGESVFEGVDGERTSFDASRFRCDRIVS